MTLVASSDFLAALPSLQGTTPEQKRTVLDDGSRVYQFVRSRELVSGMPSEDEIRKWGEGQSDRLGPDRMNAALQYLAEAGLVYYIADIAAPPPEPVRVLPLQNMTKGELQDRARELDIDGRSKMDEAELREAILAAESRVEVPAAEPTSAQEG